VIENTSFLRDHTLSITNIWSKDEKDQTNRLADAIRTDLFHRAKLTVKVEVQQRIGADNVQLKRADGKVQFIARLGMSSSANAKLAANLIKDPDGEWRVWSGRLTKHVLCHVNNLVKVLQHLLDTQAAEAVSVPGNHPIIVLPMMLWFDAVGVQSCGKIRLLDPEGQIFASGASPVESFFDYRGHEQEISQYLELFFEQLHNVHSTVFELRNGARVQVMVKFFLLDHAALWNTFKIPGGPSEQRDAFCNSVPFTWEHIFRPGQADFRSSKHKTTWAKFLQFQADLLDDLIKAGLPQTDAEWKRRKKLIQGIFGGNTGEPLFTRDLSILWDFVYVLPPLMHSANFTTTAVLNQVTECIRQMESEQKTPDNARIAQRLVSLLGDAQELQDKGSISTSFTKLREFLST
jgi:hypothetical protein